MAHGVMRGRTDSPMAQNTETPGLRFLQNVFDLLDLASCHLVAGRYPRDSSLQLDALPDQRRGKARKRRTQGGVEEKFSDFSALELVLRGDSMMTTLSAGCSKASVSSPLSSPKLGGQNCTQLAGSSTSFVGQRRGLTAQVSNLERGMRDLSVKAHLGLIPAEHKWMYEGIESKGPVSTQSWTSSGWMDAR